MPTAAPLGYIDRANEQIIIEHCAHSYGSRTYGALLTQNIVQYVGYMYTVQCSSRLSGLLQPQVSLVLSTLYWGMQF